jgi:hypothetical protein
MKNLLWGLALGGWLMTACIVGMRNPENLAAQFVFGFILTVLPLSLACWEMHVRFTRPLMRSVKRDRGWDTGERA